MPDADVKRRLGRSLKNFLALYLPLADGWDIFDNYGIEPRLMVKFNEKGQHIFDQKFYQEWLQAGGKA